MLHIGILFRWGVFMHKNLTTMLFVVFCVCCLGILPGSMAFADDLGVIEPTSSVVAASQDVVQPSKEATAAIADSKSSVQVVKPAAIPSSTDSDSSELAQKVEVPSATDVSEASQSIKADSGASQTQVATVQAEAAQVVSTEESIQTAIEADSSKVIEDGLYNISSALDSSKCIEIGGGSASDGAAAQIYSSNYSQAQRWQFVSTSDGFYKIVNVNSGKVLDVSGASTENGTRVQQYSWNGTNAQKWTVISKGDGLYGIVSALSSSCVLDLSGAGTQNCNRVQLYSNNGTKAQLWRLAQITRLIDDGMYTISSVGSGKVLDVSGGSIDNGANVQQYSPNATLAQTIQLTWNSSNGYYTMLSAVSGKAIDVAAAQDANGANVQQYSSNSTSAQKWAAVVNADGTYTFLSAVGGKAIDVAGGSKASGANVQVYESNGTNAQKWVLAPVKTWISDGVYQIVDSNNHENALSVRSASEDDAAKLQTSGRSTTAWSQKWLFQNDGTGYYAIYNLNSGKAIEVSGGSSGVCNGSLLQQSASDLVDSQLWLPFLTSDGIMFRSKLSNNYVIDIKNGATAASAVVQLYKANYSIAQKFLLKSTNAITDGAIAYVRNLDSDTMLDVAGASTSNHAVVQLYPSNGTAAQRFKVVSIGSGQYRLMNVNSAKYLDIDTKTNTTIQQFSLTSGESMKWIIAFDVNTKSFTLRNVNTGAYLSSVNGTLGLASLASTDSQRFRFNDAAISLRGFDMASYQDGIDLASVPSDFVIVKATQGNWYTFDNYAHYANSALGLSKLLGLYHYAEGVRSAVEEAKYFVNRISGYVGNALLVLDWEGDAISKGVSYAKTWLDTVHSLTGVRPLIYMSNSVVNSYDWSSVAQSYGLWNAGYYAGYDSMGYQDYPPIYGDLGAWGGCTMYQYTSSGRLDNYSGNLDLDIFYGDASMWQWLAGHSA